MKKIFLTLFLLSSVLMFSQTRSPQGKSSNGKSSNGKSSNPRVVSQGSACGQFHREYCVVETEDGNKTVWIYNAQSKSGLFNQGSTSKIRCVVYKGMDYRINVCCETAIGDKLNYKIFDAKTNELLYDNSTAQNDPLFEFQSTVTRQLIIEVTVPSGATEKDKHKPMDAACVGLLIEHKITERQGFSQY